MEADCPDGDVVFMFDNEQVIGKSWSVPAQNKVKKCLLSHMWRTETCKTAITNRFSILCMDIGLLRQGKKIVLQSYVKNQGTDQRRV